MPARRSDDGASRRVASAWLACHDEAGFGYIDAFENVAAARRYGVRVLPTKMIFHEGEVFAWIEGRHASCGTIEAIRTAARALAAVA